jgi:hypothetical protein
MLGMRREERDRIVAQSRAQALEQRHFDALHLVTGQQAEIASGQRGGLVGGQHERLDGAGSSTRARRSRSTPVKCAGARAGAPSANVADRGGTPRACT